MHIAYLLTPSGIPLGGNSGSSHHVASLVQAFSQAGHDVTLCVARQVEGPDPLPTAHILEFPTQRAPWWRRSRSLKERWQARRFAQRVLPNLQAHPPAFLYERYALFSDAGAMLRASLRCPWVLEVNAPLRWERARYEGLRGDRAAKKAEARILRAADLLVAVSHPLADWLEQEVGVPRERIVVIPNGVDQKRFFPQEANLALRARLGLTADPVVGFVGSLKPWHGPQQWCEVFERLHERLPTLQGLVIGEGPGLETMRDHLTRRGLQDTVLFTGRIPVEQVPATMSLMDILLAPYPPVERFYFCPLKVLEAQSLGIPVVSSAQGDLPRLIGAGGITVEEGDEAALVEALYAGLTDARLLQRWKSAALEQSIGRDWQDIAGRILEEIQARGLVSRTS